MAKQVVVIGGGASGLIAAITAARAGASVTILEQNEKPGKKLLATGNGRCNLTNLTMGTRFYHGGDSEFTAEIIRHFSEKDTIDFFHELGLETIDRQGWVYPLTEQASSVLSLLLLAAENLKIKVKTNEVVTRISGQKLKDGNRFVTYTETWNYPSDAVIVASGSPASAVRGSSDLVKSVADSFSAAFHPFLPALVPLRVSDACASKWAGVRVHGSVTLVVEGTAVSKSTGEIQLTERGISGIPVFQISSEAVRRLNQKEMTEVELNFIPHDTDSELTAKLFQRYQNCSYKTMQQLLIGLLPDKLIPVVCSEFSSLVPNGKLDRMSDSQLQSWMERLAHRIRHFRVKIADAASLAQAQICSGGIAVEELNSSMELQSFPGLYFCGEAVDVDGACGGYNLQWAWSSGYTAGISAAYR